MELTSIDYARLIQFTARRVYMTLLNKTQVNKILFYVYGVYLAQYGKPPFSDDTPRVWTYGPVFPRSNKKVVTGEIIGMEHFTQEEIDAFQANHEFLSRIVRIVGNMKDMQAIDLTRWSHEEGSPWYKALYIKDDKGNIIKQNPWNTEIPQQSIKDYFLNKQNLIFG